MPPKKAKTHIVFTPTQYVLQRVVPYVCHFLFKFVKCVHSNVALSHVLSLLQKRPFPLTALLLEQTKKTLDTLWYFEELKTCCFLCLHCFSRI